MNTVMIAFIIAVVYMVLKTVVYYKDSYVPNVKEGLLVFASSLGGLYVSEQFGPMKPKLTEVFTETPSF